MLRQCPPNLVVTSPTYSNLDRSLVIISRIVLYPLSVWIVLNCNPALGLLRLALKPQANFAITKETRRKHHQKTSRVSFTQMNMDYDEHLKRGDPQTHPCNPMSIIYAPYAVQAVDSGVLSSSAMSTPHCALKETCILRSSTIARIVSAVADKSEYAADLAARRLPGKCRCQRYALHLRELFCLSQPVPVC